MIKKKILSLFLAICMLVSLMPTFVFAEDDYVEPAPRTPGELSFMCKNEAITGGSIYYKLNNTGDFIKVSEEGNQYNPITLTDEATSITVRLAVNDGYELDTVRGVSFSVDGNEAFSSTNDNIAEFTSEQGYTFNLSELVGDSSVSESSFELEFGFEVKSDDPNPDPENPDPETPAHPGYEGDEVTSDLTISGDADFYINDSKMFNVAGGENVTDTAKYTHNSNDANVDFYICCFINMRYTSFKINGVEYIDLLPTPDTEEGKEALLEACKGQINEFKLAVPYADSYVIEAEQKILDDTDADYMVVGNFLWTYLEENSQSDDYIDNGRMELLSATYKGEDYNPDYSTGMGWSQSENGGDAVLPVGTIVTVKLVPDYGYQLTSFGVNGGNFGTGDEQSVFTFEIKPGNFHLGAHFTPVDDRVISTSEAVTKGNIELGGGLEGGSAQLEISDASLSEDKETGFDSVTPSGYTVTDYLNIDLYNVFYKGVDDPDDVWSSEIDTLNEKATISVQLSDSQLEGVEDPSDIVILHNVHNGDTYETISVDSYDPETKTITFKTDSFSTYAIATGNTSGEPLDPGATEDPSEPIAPGESTDPTEKPDNPDTGVNGNYAALGALLCVSAAGIIGTKVCRRKRK